MIKQTKVHLYTYFLALYYVLAPFEDLFTGSMGTLARYLAILIMVMAFFELRGRITYKNTSTNRCILWLMLLSILSIAWAIDVETTIMRIPAYLLVPGFALFIGLLPFSKREYDLLVKAVAFSGLLTMLYLYVSGAFIIGNRLILTESNDPNNFAALLLLPFTICFIKENDESYVFTIQKMILSVLLLLAIFYTGSRGAIVALVFMVGVYLFLMKDYKKLGYFMVFVLVFALLFFFVIPSSLLSDILQRFNTDKIYYDIFENENQRGGIWFHVIQDIMPNMPFYGLGAGCAGRALSLVYGYIKSVHNTYLNLVVEYGIFGLPAFCYFLYVIMKNTIVNKRFIEATLLAGFCVIIFLLDSYSKKFFWNVIMFIFITETVFCKREDIKGKLS